MGFLHSGFHSTNHKYSFTVLLSLQIGKYTILKLQYPEELFTKRIKVLVVVDYDPNANSLDPHFNMHTKANHVVARFPPTNEGLTDAAEYALMKTNSESD